jgi:hypothetical protein
MAAIDNRIYMDGWNTALRRVERFASSVMGDAD